MRKYVVYYSGKNILWALNFKSGENLKYRNACTCLVDTFQDFFYCLAHPNLSATSATDQK